MGMMEEMSKKIDAMSEEERKKFFNNVCNVNRLYMNPGEINLLPKNFKTQENCFPSGITLRDFFAGCAMVGILTGNENMTYLQSAHDAYEMADDMLAERNHH